MTTDLPFATSLGPGSSVTDLTGTWRTERAVYVDRTAPCGHACPAAQICMNGACRCKDGQLCGLLCVPTMSDVANCGACGIVCLITQKCGNGLCIDR